MLVLKDLPNVNLRKQRAFEVSFKAAQIPSVHLNGARLAHVHLLDFEPAFCCIFKGKSAELQWRSLHKFFQLHDR